MAENPTYEELERRVKELELESARCRRAEQALGEWEERYEDLVEICPYGIVTESDGRISAVNSAGVAILGASGAGEILGRPATDFVPPEDLDTMEERRRLVEMEGMVPLHAEKRLRLDGTIVDVEVTAARSTHEGRPAVQLFMRDAGESRLAEETLERAYRKIAELLKPE